MSRINFTNSSPDLEAEKRVLAAMILDAQCIPFVCEIAPEVAFCLMSHRVIRSSVLEAQSKGFVDALAVRSILANRGMLDCIGGTAYLGEIISSIPSVDCAAHYAEEVRNNWMRRNTGAA